MFILLKTDVKIVLLVINVLITPWEMRVTKDGTVKVVIPTVRYAVLMKYVQPLDNIQLPSSSDQ